jgi:hypothetical protein
MRRVAALLALVAVSAWLACRGAGGSAVSVAPEADWPDAAVIQAPAQDAGPLADGG